MAFGNPVGPVAVTPRSGVQGDADDSLYIFTPISTPGNPSNASITIQTDRLEIAASVRIVAGLMQPGDLEVDGGVAAPAMFTDDLSRLNGEPYLNADTWSLPTLNASGHIWVPHGGTIAPKAVVVSVGTSGFTLAHATKTATDFLVSVRTLGGAIPATGTVVAGSFVAVW